VGVQRVPPDVDSWAKLQNEKSNIFGRTRQQGELIGTVRRLPASWEACSSLLGLVEVGASWTVSDVEDPAQKCLTHRVKDAR